MTLERNAPVSGPWGPLGALFGLAIAFGVVIVAVLFIVLLTEVLHLDPSSVAVRYAQIIIFQLAFAMVALAAALFVTAEAGARASLHALGLRRLSSRGLVESALLGAALSSTVVGYSLLLEGFFPALHEKFAAEQQLQLELLSGPLWLFLLAALVIAPLCEELFFRGFFYGGLRRNLGFPLASGLSAALFSLIHLMPLSLPPLFVVGLAAAAIYERHRSVLAAITMHAAFNLSELIISWLAG